MQATNACDSILSNEHLISEGVLKVLADEKIEVSGAPWLKGASKSLPFGAIKARSLCSRHNSLLSPIDAAGATFFEAMRACGTTAHGRGLRFLLSGHDVERWMLRCLAIFGFSRQLAVDGAILDRDFIEQLGVISLLETASAWTKPAGLYFLGRPGQRFAQRAQLQLAPLLRTPDNALIGLLMDVQGWGFALLAADRGVIPNGLYRPASLIFDMAGVRNIIKLSWEDVHPHVAVTVGWEPNR
jgi:hypothetical protein